MIEFHRAVLPLFGEQFGVFGFRCSAEATGCGGAAEPCGRSTALPSVVDFGEIRAPAATGARGAPCPRALSLASNSTSSQNLYPLMYLGRGIMPGLDPAIPSVFAVLP